MNEYFLRIKKVVDALTTIGASVSTKNHIEVILDGLNKDYGPLITIVLSKVEIFSITKLEALLMAHEKMLERFRKSDSPIVEVNVAHKSVLDSKQISGSAENGRSGGQRGRGRGFRGGRHGDWSNSNQP